MTLKPAVQHRKSSFSTADSYRIPMPVREILELPNGYRAAVCPRCKCTIRYGSINGFVIDAANTSYGSSSALQL